MAIFNSYVKLPEGIKVDDKWGTPLQETPNGSFNRIYWKNMEYVMGDNTNKPTI
jgi:hypothetical protein